MIDVLLARGSLAAYGATLLVILGSTSCGRDKTNVDTKHSAVPSEAVRRSQPSRSVVITGTLVGPGNSPVTGSGSGPCSVEAAACIVIMQVKATRGMGARTEMDIVPIAGASGTEPNKDGRFSIELDRRALPKGTRFLVATMGLSSGLEPLRFNDNPIVFEIDDKSETIDLGRITMKSQ